MTLSGTLLPHLQNGYNNDFRTSAKMEGTTKLSGSTLKRGETDTAQTARFTVGYDES